jgi:hypothetical protein
MAGGNAERLEQEAVRTTIVGGRPPGIGQAIGAVPRGMEVLIKKAAVDAEFRALVLDHRADAGKEIGLGLLPSEAAMLNGIPRAQLAAIIANTRVEPRLRPTLLGRAAAVMLVALGVGVAVAGDPMAPGGIRPDAPISGAAVERATPQACGRGLWAAIAKADTTQMGSFYADEIVLLPGCELLKKEWGINSSGERNKAVTFKRADIMKGYQALFDKIGREKVQAVFGKVAEDKIKFSGVSLNDETFPGTRQGDIIMTVATGPGDDRLRFVLRKNEADKSWRVVMEQTDY